MIQNSQPKQKSTQGYIYTRIYCLITVVIWNVGGVYLFTNDSDIEFLFVICMMPFVIPAIFMIFNLGAFKYPFSVFGPYERSKPPKSKPAYSVSGLWGKVGWTNGSVPFFSYKVFPSGLLVSIFGMGEGFLDFAHIRRIESGFIRGKKVYHESPEIRSPIALPTEKLFKAVNTEYEKYRKNK